MKAGVHAIHWTTLAPFVGAGLLLGAERLLYGKVGGEEVTVRVEEGSAYPRPGETAHIVPREDRLHWFSQETGKRI